MIMLQQTAAHLLENITDPSMLRHTFESDAHVPSVFELSIVSESAKFLNTKQSRSQVAVKWLGALVQNSDSKALNLLGARKFASLFHHVHHATAHKSFFEKIETAGHGLVELWLTLAELCIEPARFLQSPIARFVLDCLMFIIHVILTQLVLIGFGYSDGECDENALCLGYSAWNMLTIFLVGMMVAKINELIIFGWKFFVSDKWVFFDLGVLVVYFTSLFLYHYEVDYHKSEESSNWRRLLSINCILLWFRMLSVLSLSRRFGPTVYCLPPMAEKVALFIVLMVVVDLGFSGWFVAWFGRPAVRRSSSVAAAPPAP